MFRRVMLSVEAIPLIASRFALLFFTVAGTALVWDMQWHGINPVRDHYFIAPHVGIYVGITGLLACCAVLKLFEYKIPLYIFVLFPLLSLFDEFWHRTFGIELASSPLMFWSPAHWPFGIIMWFILLTLYRTEIEKNEAVRMYMQALIYCVLPLRLFWYLLIPLAPYSNYAFLHTDFSAAISVILVLSYISAYKVHRSFEIALIGLCTLPLFSGAARLFFIWNDYVYNVGSTHLLLFMVLFLCIVSGLIGELSYIFLGSLVAAWMFLLIYLVNGVFALESFLFTLAVTAVAGGVYFHLESYVLRYLEKYRLIPIRDATVLPK